MIVFVIVNATSHLMRSTIHTNFYFKQNSGEFTKETTSSLWLYTTTLKTHNDKLCAGLANLPNQRAPQTWADPIVGTALDDIGHVLLKQSK
jgi:hypothetical protein